MNRTPDEDENDMEYQREYPSQAVEVNPGAQDLNEPAEADKCKENSIIALLIFQSLCSFFCQFYPIKSQ